MVRPAADARRHPAGLRPDPADHAAPVRADVARAHRARARSSSCGSASRCAASSRPGTTCRSTAPPTATTAAAQPDGDSLIEDPTSRCRHGRFETGGGRPPPPGGSTSTRSRSRPRRPARRTIFSTALYHSLIKPCFAAGESPFWPTNGPFVVRHLHDVGHLPDPAAVDHRAVPRPGRRAGQRAAQHLRGGGQPADRLPDGQGRRPVLPAGQRAGPDLPGRPLPARRPRRRLGLGAVPHGHRPAPRVRGGVPAPRRHPPDHPHPRPRLRLPVHRQGRPLRRRPRRWPTSSRSWPPAG